MTANKIDKSRTGWYRDEATNGFWIIACCVGRQQARGLPRGRGCPMPSCHRHHDGFHRKLDQEQACNIAHCACHGPSATYRAATEEEMAVKWAVKRSLDAAQAREAVEQIVSLLPPSEWTYTKQLDPSTYEIVAQLPNHVKVRLLVDSDGARFSQIEAPCPVGRFSPQGALAVVDQLGRKAFLTEMP